MSALHTSRLIAAFRQSSSATPEARALIAKLPREHDSKIIDVLVDAAVTQGGPLGHIWHLGTAIAGSLAAVSGTFGLYRMLQVMPLSPVWATLPLLGLALVLWGALIGGRSLRKPSSQTLDALELSLRGAKVPAAQARDLARYARGLELSDPRQGRAGRYGSSLLIGAGTAWAVLSFWIIYFVTIGQTAVSGAW